MGRYDLGLSENEFWELTLKELNALIERHENNHEWLDYRAALICSMIANTNRDPKRKAQPYTPQDFMPKKERNPQTGEQIYAQVQLLNAMFGGDVIEE